MKNPTALMALAIIPLALGSCSKKSADTTITQQNASGVQVVTNDGRFVTVIEQTTNSAQKSADTAIAQQEASGVPVVTNDGRFVTVTKRTTNSTPASGQSK